MMKHGIVGFKEDYNVYGKVPNMWNLTNHSVIEISSELVVEGIYGRISCIGSLIIQCQTSCLIYRGFT